jgi:hypothetical protein
MKLLAAVILAALIVLPFAAAQDHPRAEAFAGWSFEDTAPCGTTTTYQQGEACGLEAGELVKTAFNGWNAAVAGYPVKHFGITADFSGHYGTYAGPTSRYTFLFGPSFPFRIWNLTPFAHVLLGVLHVDTTENPTLTYSGFARAVGGGLDLKASKRFAVRVGQFDYEWVHVPAYNLPDTAGSFRVSAGIVFKF